MLLLRAYDTLICLIDLDAAADIQCRHRYAPVLLRHCHLLMMPC